MDDRSYSPGSVRKLLARFPELVDTADELKSLRVTGMSRKRSKAGNDYRHRRAVLVADLRQAFGRLSVDDPQAAAMVYRHYIEGRQLADLADEFERCQRTIGYRVERGLRAMASYLGWVEDAQDAAD